MKQMSFFHLPTTHCERCGRLLTNPTSIEAQRGPVCRGHAKGDDKDMDNKFQDFTLFEPITEGIILKHVVIHHSPTGYEFGYAGSGPADLALNICEIMLNRSGFDGVRMTCFDGDCFELAFSVYQAFKFEFIAGVDEAGATIPYEVASNWIKDRIAEYAEKN